MCKRRGDCIDNVGELIMQKKLDITQHNHLITGEKLSTKLAVKNINAIQKARLLSILDVPNEADEIRLQQLDSWITKQCFAEFCGAGECRHSSIAYLRYIGAFDGAINDEKVDRFIQLLSEYRDGNGRWKGFPFYYTLLVLSELYNESARIELEYAIPACKRAMKRIKNDSYSKIRLEILSAVINVGESTSVLDLLLIDNEII